MTSQISGDGVTIAIPLMIDGIDMAMIGLNWVCYQRLISWVALVFLWALGVAEFVTLKPHNNYR